MCTLTVIQQDSELIITMNRDESRDRHEAGLEQTQITSTTGLPSTIIFPKDSHAGGTWLGINNNGVAMCLLNRYQDQKKTDGSIISRGHIIPTALAHGNIESIIEHLIPLNFIHYNPFDLFVFSQQQSIQVSWNGSNSSMTSIDLNQPLMHTSSSVRFPAVAKYRNVLFSGIVKKEAAIDHHKILQFHLQQDSKDPSSSVLMSREETHTKSIVQIQIANQSTQLSYSRENEIKKLLTQKIINKENSTIMTLTHLNNVSTNISAIHQH